MFYTDTRALIHGRPQLIVSEKKTVNVNNNTCYKRLGKQKYSFFLRRQTTFLFIFFGQESSQIPFSSSFPEQELHVQCAKKRRPKKKRFSQAPLSHLVAFQEILKIPWIHSRANQMPLQIRRKESCVGPPVTSLSTAPPQFAALRANWAPSTWIV